MERPPISSVIVAGDNGFTNLAASLDRLDQWIIRVSEGF